MEEGRVWTEGVQECPSYMSDRGCIIRDYWYSTLVRVLTVPEIRRLTFLLPGHLSLYFTLREKLLLLLNLPPIRLLLAKRVYRSRNNPQSQHQLKIMVDYKGPPPPKGTWRRAFWERK